MLAGDHQAAIPPFARSRGSAQTGGCDSTWTRGGVYQKKNSGLGVASEPHRSSSSSSFFFFFFFFFQNDVVFWEYFLN
jgi:hypothetical protein